MISQFTDQEAIRKLLDEHPLLARFAAEFCNNFGTKVAYSASRPRSVSLHTADGLYVGSLYYEPEGGRDKNGARIPVYYYDSETCVQKERSSARTGRHTRDSTKISTLIRTVKMHKEEPTAEKITQNYKSGIRYAFIYARGNNRTTHLQLTGDALMAMARNYLGVDSDMVRIYHAEIEEAYKRYEEEVRANTTRLGTFERFAKGSYAIGYMTDETRQPYYVVGEVTATAVTLNDRTDIQFQGPMKRYSTLADCPEVAPHVPIIAAWASGKFPNHRAEGELGLPRSDTYHDDIDVATGYNTSAAFWTLIPKEAP